MELLNKVNQNVAACERIMGRTLTNAEYLSVRMMVGKIYAELWRKGKVA